MALFHAGVFFSTVYFFFCEWRDERLPLLKYFWVWLFLVSPSFSLHRHLTYQTQAGISVINPFLVLGRMWNCQKEELTDKLFLCLCVSARVCVCIRLATLLLQKFGVFIRNSSRNVVPDAIHWETTQELRTRNWQHFQIFLFLIRIFMCMNILLPYCWSQGAMART